MIECICGKKFEKTANNKKYCSNACKHKAWNLANPEAGRLKSKKWYEANKEKAKQASNEYKRKFPNKAKAIKLKRYYGMTLEQYNEMKIAQNGVCKICSNTCKTGRDLAVDHCHSTGKIRGLLCHNCNTMLGAAQDKVDVLRKGIEYLC